RRPRRADHAAAARRGAPPRGDAAGRVRRNPLPAADDEARGPLRAGARPPPLGRYIRPVPSLTVDNLERRFGHVRALRGVSFSLGQGDVLAIFGPNGAGKTTLLRLLAGILRPDKGRVLIDGVPLTRDAAAQRRRIGLIAHASLCYDGLTAAENLEFYARLYGLP